MKKLQFLFYPPKGETQSAYPLIIFLHGIGERGDDLELVKKWGLPRLAAAGEITLPAYIAAPQCPADVRWEHSSTNWTHCLMICWRSTRLIGCVYC